MTAYSTVPVKFRRAMNSAWLTVCRGECCLVLIGVRYVDCEHLFLTGNTRDFLSLSKLLQSVWDNVALLNTQCLSLVFLEPPALTSPLASAQQESCDVLCVCTYWLSVGQRMEKWGKLASGWDGAMQEQRVRDWKREWTPVSAYIGGLFLNPHPLPCSLLLHFLSRSLRKPTWPSLLPAFI